jgi:hypothetical protein
MQQSRAFRARQDKQLARSDLDEFPCTPNRALRSSLRGMLAEQGTHTQLLSHDGCYRRLWEKQAGFKLDPAHHHAEISIERLRLVGAFYGMSDALLAEARTLLRTKKYPAGHVVSRQGEYGASVYIIVRGSVELLMEKSAGDVRCVGV